MPGSHDHDAARSPCRVIVVGCGLGGLAAAIGFGKSGHEVTIFERMAELQELGAGINVPPNATIIFREWGILEAVKSHAIQPIAAIMRSYRDGVELSTQNLDSAIQDVYTAPYLVIHRADLHNVLLQKARSLGVLIRLNCDITSINFFKPSIELSNGESYESDLILGADGERSKCREAMLGCKDPLQDSGDQVFRITVKNSEVVQHESLADLVKTPNINCWVGPEANAVTYSLKKDELLNVVLTRARDVGEQVQYGPQKAEVSEVRKAFSQWDPRFQTLLCFAQECSKWNLLEPNETPHWTHPDGNFALLGDSAHAMLPFLGQGAAMAFEDAAVLGLLFSKMQHKSQLPDILSIYERIRKPRTMEMRRRSRAMRDVYAMSDGPEQQERDRQLLQHAPFEGFPNFLADPVFQKWLFAYDALGEAEKAWKIYSRGEWPGTRGLWKVQA